jgi:hypothetical protein
MFNPIKRLKANKSQSNLLLGEKNTMEYPSNDELVMPKSSEPKQGSKLENNKQWLIIKTYNTIGQKSTLNRCFIMPIVPQPLDCNELLILGCHYGRSESPFAYDYKLNRYKKFQKEAIQMDMYRSNDIVQFSDKFIYVRPFCKVGAPCE